MPTRTPPRARRHSWVVFVLAVLARSGELRAEPAVEQSTALVGVEVELRNCPSITGKELRRIVAAELGPEVRVGVHVPESASGDTGVDVHWVRPDVAGVVVVCSRNVVRVEVLDAVTGKRLVRHLDLARYPASVRARLLGVSVAELIAASWIELAARKRPELRPMEARGSEQSRAAAAGVAEHTLLPLPTFEVEPGLGARTLDQGRLTVLGGAIAFSRNQRGWLAFGGDLTMESGSDGVSLGRVGVTLGSLGGSVRLRQELAMLRFEAGLGARVGFVRFQGTASDREANAAGRTAVLPWAGPVALVRLGVAPARRLVLTGSFEAGLATLAAEARVGGAAETAVDGEWLGLRIGLGVLFDG
jgi:hypothetical protein